MAGPEPQSPDWFLKRLHGELAASKSRMLRFDAYYEGEHRLAFATTKFREAFGSLFRAFADNWCGLVVDAVPERLRVQGFRFGDTPAADGAAHAIWQSNNLDAESSTCHREALIQGRAYSLTQPSETEGGHPVITVESPLECIVGYEPGTRRRAAGLKEWWDDWTGFIFATLYLPDGVFKFQSVSKMTSVELDPASSITWKPRDGLPESEPWPLPNPARAVPLVPFENRPRLRRPPASEIKDVIGPQDAVNKLCADMMVAAEFQAFRQRVLMGAEIPTDPVTGQPVPGWQHAVSRMWIIGDADPDHPARVEEFGTVDLENFVKAVEMYVSHIASQTRTPPHYFERPGGQFPSGESIKSAETGLVAKVREKMLYFGESWEETLRLAFAIEGDPRAEEFGAETIWGDPESRTESEHVDALVKLASLGVPEEALWERGGFSPTEIARFKAMREEQAALAPAPVLTIAPPPALAGANGSSGT